jgi:hypothetical protein
MRSRPSLITILTILYHEVGESSLVDAHVREGGERVFKFMKTILILVILGLQEDAIGRYLP